MLLLSTLGIGFCMKGFENSCGIDPIRRESAARFERPAIKAGEVCSLSHLSIVQ